MKRRFLGSFAILSFALCLTTVALWVASYHRTIAATLRKDREYVAGCWHGEFWLEKHTRLTEPAFPTTPAEPRAEPYASQWELYTGGLLGPLARFCRTHRVDQVGSFWNDWTDVRYLAVPCWAVMLATTIVPLMWSVARYHLYRRRKFSLCLICGYDLRASVERCPECGTPIPEGVQRRPIR